MSDQCPTCGAAVRIEASGTTHYMVPTDAERILDLEDVLRAIVEYNERGYDAEYIRAIEDAKALLS